MLGAPRGKFKMAVSLTDFGIQCTHNAHWIIWRMADFCENLRLLRAPYGAENKCGFYILVIATLYLLYQWLRHGNPTRTTISLCTYILLFSVAVSKSNNSSDDPERVKITKKQRWFSAICHQSWLHVLRL